MGDFVAEEIEAIKKTLGESTVLTGFYSNGEISPSTQPPVANCTTKPWPSRCGWSNE
jgi:hypothetical protein